MDRFTPGDRIRVDIPDESDPDYESLHGKEGVVVDLLADDADAVTGDERDGRLYRVELDDGAVMDLRWRDLRPPLSE